MGVEQRKGRPYLNDRQRVGGRRVAEYVGPLTGEEADLLRRRAAMDRDRRSSGRLPVTDAAGISSPRCTTPGRDHRMGWEKRGGRSYYYRARRVDGRVVKQYVGPGPAATSAAAADAARRQADEARAESLARQRAADEALQAVLDWLDESTRPGGSPSHSPAVHPAGPTP